MAFNKDATRKLNFKKRTFEDTKKRSEQWGNLRDGYLSDHVSLWKPSDGENCIRILPATWDEANHYGLDIFVHYNIGPDSSAFLDLKRMKGEPDPISEAFDIAMAEGDEEYAKEIRSVKRVLVYLIDRDKPKDGIQMWAMPWTVDKDIATQSMDSRSREILYIDDPDEGYDVYISREGQGARTKYSVKIARNPSELQMDDNMISILEDHPLPSCLVFHPYEHIAEVFKGLKPKKAAVSEKAEDEKPVASKSRAAAPATAPEPEVDLPTWEEIQSSDEDTLFDMIESMELDVQTEEITSLEELRETIAQVLGISKPVVKQPMRRAFSKNTEEPVAKKKPEPEPEVEAPAKSSVSDKLASLRNRNK